MIEESPSGNRLLGFYRGVVIQHLTHGYCKIWIPGVHPEVWKNKPKYLPPAEQASSIFAGTNNGSGVFTYPNIGSVVWCFFANEDQNHPVYFAASLGGENAFGQYELVKLSNDVESTRHLVTSGKTHIEWYESGKLSAIVEDPDRRDAKVDYNNSYIGLISDDVVSCRQIQDQVNNQEIPYLNCQIVLDNSVSDGILSSSTNRFFIEQSSFNQTISSEGKQIISSDDINYQVCTYDIKGNDGVARRNLLSTSTISENSNITITNGGQAQSTVRNYSSEGQANNLHEQNLDGKTTDYILSKDKSNLAYSYSGQNQVFLSNVIVDGYDEYSQVCDAKSEKITHGIEKNQKYTYSLVQQDASGKSAKTINSKHDDLLNLDVDDDSAQISISKEFNDISSIVSQSSSNLSFLKTGTSSGYLQIDELARIYLKILENHFLQKTTNGTTKTEQVDYDIGAEFSNENVFKLGVLSSLKISDGQTTNQVEFQNYLKGDFGDDLLLETKYQKKTQEGQKNNAETYISLNSSSSKKTGINVASNNNVSKIDFTGEIDTVTGKVTLNITSNKTGKTSSIQMDINGNISLISSTQISIKAPTINIEGSTLNMSGGSGDCKINNVSLLTHSHYEMQSGDVVSSGVTKTKSATASN